MNSEDDIALAIEAALDGISEGDITIDSNNNNNNNKSSSIPHYDDHQVQNSQNKDSPDFKRKTIITIDDTTENNNNNTRKKKKQRRTITRNSFQNEVQEIIDVESIEQQKQQDNDVIVL